MKKIIFQLGICLFSVLITDAQNLVYDANAQARNTGSFTGVSVGSGIKLYLSQGKTQAVAVSAEDAKYVERIITEVKNGILKIHVDGKLWNKWNWGNEKLKAYVTVTELNSLDVSGGCVAEITGEINVNNLDADLSGGSIIKGTLRGNAIKADLSGGSIATLSGSFDQAKIEASGGSIFKDYDFSIANCEIDASGGSIINITIDKEMSADASGGSIINYKGAGVIKNVDASGGSIIRKKDN